MTQKEIYDLEKTNKDRIYLYREGIFWKAYERSAFYLSGPGGKLKPTKKFIKSVGDYFIYSPSLNKVIIKTKPSANNHNIKKGGNIIQSA